ncbi:Copia protein [Durusdinium trenchii]|uniref:Copia protein n=1 Tax=Durusdinium trenchii TaxID=1381693 RepID=A0ABP0PYU0_9DINO
MHRARVRRIWGVHRNWARWTSDPTWPLEALKGEPAKAGWDAFTTDSQAIVTSHINDFQTEAVSIAQEEGMASADTIYQGHLAEHVDAAQELQTGAEELMAQGARGWNGTMWSRDARVGHWDDRRRPRQRLGVNGMAEAQAIQADSMALQAEMQQTSAALQVGRLDATGEIQRLTTEMDGHRAEAQEISDRASALGEDMQVHSEEAQQMAADAEAMAADAETLKNDALQLKDAALEELTADETLQAVLEELIDCAKRIANRILDLAAETIKSMMRQILALVPDLFFACLEVAWIASELLARFGASPEAALDIITGFGWIITAARLSYKLAKFARRKWREWKDSKKQQLCGKEPQLDCCVNNVMSWYDQQAADWEVKAQRVTEAEFRADTQSFLAKAQRYPDQCTPWVVTMFSDATDNETLKVLIAREAEATPPSIYTTPARLYGLFGKGFLRRKFPVRLVVSRSSTAAQSFLVEFPKKKRQKRQRVLRFNALCEAHGKRSTWNRAWHGLRVLKTKKKVPMGVVFRFGKGVLGQRTFDLDGSNPCAVAHAMCRAACYRPEKCDDYIDPEGYIGLEPLVEMDDSHAARSNEKNLLPLCAPVAGLARANGVKESAVKKETQLGPTALRPFVWQHMFKEGKAQAMSRTEALAYAASVCDQHVIPFWSCGSEECSLCQGVASFYFSSQNPDDWCRSFKLPDSENVSESYARDLGRHFKCNYLAGYLSSTDDQRRLSGRESTMQEVCNARTMCSEQTNLLPQLDMRPGLQKGTDAYADSQCRMCLEFVQRAAAGLRPKNFCKAIPRMYQQQKIFCEGTLEEMMEALPAIKDAQDRPLAAYIFSGLCCKLTGSACDRYCRGWVQRKPSSRETLQNPSPLLLAGEDTLPAPPGKVRVLETWQSEAAKGLAQSPWLQRALTLGTFL